MPSLFRFSIFTGHDDHRKEGKNLYSTAAHDFRSVFVDDDRASTVVSRRCPLERFSNECRKTKTKVITPANHNKHKLPNEPIRTRSKYM